MFNILFYLAFTLSGSGLVAYSQTIADHFELIALIFGYIGAVVGTVSLFKLFKLLGV